MSDYGKWTDDAIRDGVASGHISEWDGLQELDRRHSTVRQVPTPKEVFDHAG